MFIVLLLLVRSDSQSSESLFFEFFQCSERSGSFDVPMNLYEEE